MTTPTNSSITDLVRRRVDGTYSVDEWGLDPDFVKMTSPLAGLRWGVEVEGRGNLPERGPALIVHNRRFGWSEPFVVAQAVRSAIGRHARPVGTPDYAPVGTLMRRLGGVIDRPDEVAGLLRSGAIVALPLSRELPSRHRAGEIHPSALASACDQGVAIVPAALYGHETGRRWRIVFGQSIQPTLDPPQDGLQASAVELARNVSTEVQKLLDSIVPRRWPFG